MCCRTGNRSKVETVRKSHVHRLEMLRITAAAQFSLHHFHLCCSCCYLTGQWMKPEAKTLVEEQCWQTFDVSITTTATYFTPLSLLRCYYLTGQWMKPKVKTHGGTMLAGLWHHHCYSYNLRFTVIFVLLLFNRAVKSQKWRLVEEQCWQACDISITATATNIHHHYCLVIVIT